MYSVCVKKLCDVALCLSVCWKCFIDVYDTMGVTIVLSLGLWPNGLFLGHKVELHTWQCQLGLVSCNMQKGHIKVILG